MKTIEQIITERFEEKINNGDFEKIINEKHITQTELGNKLGLKQNTISDMLNKKIKPTFETVMTMSKLLDVSCEEILNYFTGGETNA